jgi:hypothetical protein
MLRSPTDTLRDGRSETCDDISQLLLDAELISVAHAQTARISDRAESWRETLGPGYVGAETDWTMLEASGLWLEEFTAAFPETPPQRLRDRLLAPGRRWPNFDELRRSDSSYLETVGVIADVFDLARGDQLRAVADAQASQEVVATVDALMAAIDRLPGWCDYTAARDRIRRSEKR